MQRKWLMAVVMLGLIAVGACSAWGADAAAPAKKINVLIITGGHGYDQANFFKLFEGYPDIAYTHVDLKAGGEIFDTIDNWNYDAIVLYNFNQKITEAQQANFLKLMDKGVGLLVLHHANGAYNNWDEFWKIAGVTYHFKPWEENGKKMERSGYKGNVNVKVHVADADHPITKGLADFEITDETYCRTTIDPGVHALLTTEEPSSDKIIGWVKTYRKSNVCYLQSGHDQKAYANPNLRTLVVRAVRWVAGQPAEPAAAGAKAGAAAPRLKFFAAPAAEGAARAVRAVVLTGGHDYDQKPFLALFDAMSGITYKHIDQKAGGEAFDNIDDWKYDVIVLYNHNQKITDKQAENLLKLLDKGVGLVILHHAIAAYQNWPEFRKILGGRYHLKDEVDSDGTKHARSQYKHDVDMKVHVEDPKCPVAAGVSDFTIHDETYKGYTVDPQVKVFLTTDDPTSEKAIGWTNTCRKANVCFLELGHDAKAYASKEMQTLYAQAMKWAAGGAK